MLLFPMDDDNIPGIVLAVGDDGGAPADFWSLVGDEFTALGYEPFTDQDRVSSLG